MNLDWLSKMISIINVGLINRDQYVRVQRIVFNIQVLHVLYEQGAINYFYIQNDVVVVGLKYYQNKSVIQRISRVSKPSKKIYLTVKKLGRFQRRHKLSCFYILSTSFGLVASNYATIPFSNPVAGLILLKVDLT